MVQNTGDKPFEGILVQMKGAPGAKTAGKSRHSIPFSFMRRCTSGTEV